MDALTRRRFLKASGVAGASALAAGAGVYGLKEILDTTGWDDRPVDAKTLVLVTLYGGNDGLNTVIPYADPAYHDARPQLAYPPEKVLRLDDRIGLNPSMTGLAGLFKNKQLAIVRGIEYANPDHSHFRSMDIWQTGSPDRPVNTGWLGRWLDASGGDPRHAVSFEPVLPVVLAGEKTAGASVPATGSALPKGVTRQALTALGAVQPGEPAMQARAARSFADLVSIDDMLHTVPSAPPSPPPSQPTPSQSEDPNQPQATGTGGRGGLGDQLDLVARCVEAGVATRAYSVSLGGFDTHAQERNQQERLLGELDSALTEFTKRMAGTGKGRQVVLVVYSEFGRRVKANASDGTDHGTASDVILMGAPVRGGLYGEQPSLTELNNGDLKVSTDFRDLYATLLNKVLAADPGPVLAGWKGRLDTVLT
jgi:uncharacterized protein (DUF1501 family)